MALYSPISADNEERTAPLAPPLPGTLTEFPPFRERAPWFGGDLQTLRNVLCRAPADLPLRERLRLPVSGGDQLAARLDRPAQPTARPLIVLVHGLAGSEASRNVIASARYLVSQGWQVLHTLPPAYSRNGIVLAGHSLGGNLILKFMGEGGHRLPVLAAVSISAPIDLAAICERMMMRRNLAYHRYMLNAIKREALAPGADLTAAERAAIAAARNVYEFDEHFIAPRFGYRNALDYYQSNSAKHFLAGATAPVLILHALDDPWIPAPCYTAISWEQLPLIEAVLTPRGGHLGFHGQESFIPWHDRVTAWWLARKLERAQA